MTDKIKNIETGQYSCDLCGGLFAENKVIFLKPPSKSEGNYIFLCNRCQVQALKKIAFRLSKEEENEM